MLISEKENSFMIMRALKNAQFTLIFVGNVPLLKKNCGPRFGITQEAWIENVSLRKFVAESAGPPFRSGVRLEAIGPIG